MRPPYQSFVFDADAWLKRIPRPDRSGYIAVFIMLSAFFDIIYPGTVDPSLCSFIPFMSCVQVEKPADRIARKKFNLLYFFHEGGKSRSKEATCHLDVRTSPVLDGFDEIIHRRFERVKKADLLTSDPREGYPKGEEWEDKTLTRPHIYYTTSDGSIHASQYIFTVYSFTTINNVATFDFIDIPFGYKVAMRWHCGEKNPPPQKKQNIIVSNHFRGN